MSTLLRDPDKRGSPCFSFKTSPLPNEALLTGAQKAMLKPPREKHGDPVKGVGLRVRSP